MGKKRTPGRTKKGWEGNRVWKSLLLGGLIGTGLCALAAALVIAGVIPQDGLMTAGRCAALLATFASGVACAMMAKEQKARWAAVGGLGSALCAMAGNLLFVGRMKLPLLWVGAAGAAVLAVSLRQLWPQKRRARRK